MDKGGILMLVKIEKNNKLALPERICHELGISKGDRFHISIKEGKIALRPSNYQHRDEDKSQKNGKGRILMFGSASEAFDEADFD
jgi:AbrB family looped-hinge helix DNA binding protein